MKQHAAAARALLLQERMILNQRVGMEGATSYFVSATRDVNADAAKAFRKAKRSRCASMGIILFKVA